MDFHVPDLGPPSRLRALLDHFAVIEDPRQQHRVAYPLPEMMLLAVCGTIVDCDDYDAIALWGEEHLDYLRGVSPEDPGSGSCRGRRAHPVHLGDPAALVGRARAIQRT